MMMILKILFTQHCSMGVRCARPTVRDARPPRGHLHQRNVRQIPGSGRSASCPDFVRATFLSSLFFSSFYHGPIYMDLCIYRSMVSTLRCPNPDFVPQGKKDKIRVAVLERGRV